MSATFFNLFLEAVKACPIKVESVSLIEFKFEPENIKYLHVKSLDMQLTAVKNNRNVLVDNINGIKFTQLQILENFSTCLEVL